ncbi:FimV/HubP family polar landmark protein, partial [Thalassotalea sp. 1_MG-2023]|uniref:FimV/HubP family polar landmark protein n=1 Tax=Thalassotalea sp. 1_MG-2023 TaxID=3062680 RepID=UPI0026E2CD34
APNEPSPEETPSVDDDLSSELSDPDDIDALMDSMAAAPNEPSPEETPSVDDDLSQELSDPDDIDALMDSMAAAPNEPSPEETPSVDDDLSSELSDPDDIDALMDSMAAPTASENNPLVEAEPSNDTIPTVEDEQPSEIEQSSPTEGDNKALIDNLPEEYVESFLAVDLSELAESNVEEPEPIVTQEQVSDDIDIDALLAEEQEKQEVSPQEQQGSVEEDLDIDDLLAEVAQESGALSDDEPLEIGDDIESANTEDITDGLSDELQADLNAEFDESTLSELLNDEQTSNEAVEITPDFTDSNVLADLLADDNEKTQIEKVEAKELEDIEELDNLDFDELLANIEEEPAESSSESFNVSAEQQAEEKETSNDFSQDTESQNKNFISVDELISETLSEGSDDEEPYDKTNIDVGLGEFPEFTRDINQIDVDEDDDSGVTAKLDLAKVYIEIGDNDNAEVILQDVVKLGDADQQYEAQQLLDGLK